MARAANPVEAGPAAAPAAEILRTLGGEIDALAVLSDELQDVLGRALGGLRMDGGALISLQSMDLLSQRLRSLASFTAGLADRCDPAWRIDRAGAASQLSLEDLKTSLAGMTVEAPSDPGDFELFG